MRDTEWERDAPRRKERMGRQTPVSGLQKFRGAHRGTSSPLTLQQPWWEGLCHGRACIQAPVVQSDPCVGWNAWPVPQKSLETSKSMEELITQL